MAFQAWSFTPSGEQLTFDVSCDIAFFAAKKDSKVAVKNRCPLPLIDNLFVALTGAKVYSNIDITTWYNQVRIDHRNTP
ncbi:hypothetical protein DSO57_1021456 [Entomophthora muscae]|uniref:Uncharacterized protein n=1 Tax=Entomophthora muscae TaxID=34485 RepID=A0ACC2TED1_9FUNG|nr:hypothetical protein DSO57_1021456 [Entomophthora muscae]